MVPVRRLTGKHDLSKMCFSPVATAINCTRLGLSDRLDYVERNLIEK